MAHSSNSQLATDAVQARQRTLPKHHPNSQLAADAVQARPTHPIKTKPQGYKHALYKLWHLAYLDKRAFGQAALQLSQEDILDICRRSKRQPEQGVYVIPVQPTRPLSPANAVLVDKAQRKFLLAFWKLRKDEANYTLCVERWMKT